MCENLPIVSDDDLQLTRRNDLGLSCAEGSQQDPQASSPDGCDIRKGDLTSVCLFHGASAVHPLPDIPHLESLEALQPLQCFPQPVPCPQEPGVFALLPSDHHGVSVSAAMAFPSVEVTHAQVVTSTVASHGRVKERKKKCKSAYKHVPHREKPPHLVARRNARERRRVQSVNVAFARLRRVVPGTSGRSKRVSKVKILQGAIDYIYHLQDLLEEDSAPFSNNNCSSLHHDSDLGARGACNLHHSADGAGVGGVRERDGEMTGEGAEGVPQTDSPQRPLLQENPSQDSISSFLSYGSDGADGSGWSDTEELGEAEYLGECISQDLMAEY